ncbi:MAG: diguanylate phosphodiesterase [Sulfurimonas sp. RIFOXYD12_FULL_33_39]|uniref:EAL and HDOD domain-containing protein n=1 Tax=unclassified Sulfurimonas TaxID=2623549 RepID=UPI0008AEECE7|nr:MULTISPECIES: EAL domain-containing protein [unclassified Sulfurimonas]OHE07684.1 MAG: diguanylate phosphodiesterase [Sulfurimonas sp. RIFCSPLOWO2_12_FULL_34_6]OHE10752.1 MAG: diguanylate phosphodiesterase [Sulfurimonas sp. RIFOXYD12_FULL_33_39]OHE13478.1 MAG: diguanylate phosphodiesterase [Sulfurimonas sp. RIFOXYD2_FULL_34_21]
MDNIYLGRQPILDISGNLDSYEVLYSQKDKANSYGENDFIPAAIISNLLNKFGTNQVLGSRRALVKVGEKFLLSDIIFTIPREFFIFSLLEEIEMSQRVVERLQQLKEKGYVLALDEIKIDRNTITKYKDAWNEISFIKINLHADFVKDMSSKSILTTIKARGIKVIGTKIEDEKRYDTAKALGCVLFQGYFFSKPKILENTKYDPTRANILRLYSLLMEDTNIDEITAEFERNHALTVQLLRYINSGAFEFTNTISSIHHVLTLVGRKPLAQWLMLMIYAKSVSKESDVSPIMLMIKNRTELMVSILKKVKHDSGSNTLGKAYFVGVLSLIDTIFSTPLVKILNSMNIEDEVRNALLKGEGILGEIYMLIRDVEQFNTKSVALFEKKHNLQSGVLDNLLLESMRKVTAFENALSSSSTKDSTWML